MYALISAGLATLSAPSDFVWDHLFFLVDDPAPSVELLEAEGFRVLPDTSVHEGQGTSSLSMLFDNGYVELLWVRDAEELAAGDPTLAYRLLESEAGLATGVAVAGSGSESVFPFPTRSYQAAWMEPGTEILFAETRLDEPEVFIVPEYMTFAAGTQGMKITEALPHRNGVERVTQVRFVRPSRERSESFAWLLSQGLVEEELGEELLLEIELDEGRLGRSIDLRPSVAVVIRY